MGELHGYNLEGYYDIHELNKTGVLDRAVRRVRVEGPNLERARNEAVGAIKCVAKETGKRAEARPLLAKLRETPADATLHAEIRALFRKP